MWINSQSQTSQRDYTPYVFVFVVAVCARVFFLVWIDEPILFFKYPYFAEKLAGGGDIGSRLVDLSPFYLYFLTVLRKAFAIDWTTVKLIHSLIGALNALLILALGRRLFNRTAGIFAALIYALYANVIILETTLEPTVFILLFNLLVVYFLVLVKEDDRSSSQIIGLLIAAGLCTGLSIITKPNSLLFLLLGIGWLLFFPTGLPIPCKRWVQVMIFCGSAILVIMPVTVRNYVTLNDFVLVTADAGKVFYHGNARGATALEGIGLPGYVSDDGDVEPDYEHVIFRETAARLSGKDITPSESSRFWVERTLADILADPAEYLKREIKKFIFFFTDYEMHYIASAHTEYKKTLGFPLVRYGIIVSLGIVGMLLSLRRMKPLFLLYGAFGVYLCAGMLFLVQSRYRTPAVPYLCLFAGYALYRMKEMMTAGKLKSLGTTVVLACVLFVFSNTAFRGEIVEQDRWQEATKTSYEMRARPLFDRGRYRDAIVHLDHCLAAVPHFVPAINLRGRAYAMSGDYEMAESDFEKVISLNPAGFQGYRNIGFVYMLQGKTDRAVIFLTKALTLQPQDKRVQDALKKLQ